MRIDRGTLVNKMLKTCSVSYHMKDKETGFESFGEGTFKGIQIIAEKSNNKNITKIIGLETFIVPKSEAEEQIHGFANFLKEKFACSVNVGNLPGKNAGKVLLFLCLGNSCTWKFHQLVIGFVQRRTQNQIELYQHTQQVG